MQPTLAVRESVPFSQVTSTGDVCVPGSLAALRPPRALYWPSVGTFFAQQSPDSSSFKYVILAYVAPSLI
ncbi:hypothetical protein PAPYR_5905 [Paratrimastix pyriformis]|uniref:Uncharacterized protein n=1 Tax=Paratrimastix pyriformis TaxID=342808 RepID=A0ABQ8UK77_9EUKA|nr:hypothetical protein PAPYR_5905 [Paratrimastix pyriformis]